MTESVLLYSKYSDSCKVLSSMITPELIEKTSLKLLCIDNSDVRKRVKLNGLLNINIVPCLLTFNSTGVVEKYEGNVAHSYLREVVKSISPPVIVLKPVEPPKPVSRPQIKPQRPIQQRPSQTRPQPSQPLQPSSQEEPVGGTSIGDIPVTEGEPEEEPPSEEPENPATLGDRYTTSAPRPSIRKDESNYEYGEEIDNMYQQNPAEQQRHAGGISTKVKPISSIKTSGDISSMAANIAKMREQEITITGPKAGNNRK